MQKVDDPAALPVARAGALKLAHHDLDWSPAALISLIDRLARLAGNDAVCSTPPKSSERDGTAGADLDSYSEESRSSRPTEAGASGMAVHPLSALRGFLAQADVAGTMTRFLLHLVSRALSGTANQSSSQPPAIVLRVLTVLIQSLEYRLFDLHLAWQSSAESGYRNLVPQLVTILSDCLHNEAIDRLCYTPASVGLLTILRRLYVETETASFSDVCSFMCEVHAGVDGEGAAAVRQRMMQAVQVRIVMATLVVYRAVI